MHRHWGTAAPKSGTVSGDGTQLIVVITRGLPRKALTRGRVEPPPKSVVILALTGVDTIADELL